jgi:hypothetical protein
MRRDPRTDPREGDVLSQASGTRELHIDHVGMPSDGDETEVYYRVTDGLGGLLAASRTPLSVWRESAPYTCEEKNNE